LSANLSGLTTLQWHYAQQLIARCAQQNVKESHQKERDREMRRKVLVEEQAKRKSAGENNKVTRRRTNWQHTFGGYGVVMDTSLGGDMYDEALPYMDE
jgi:hypothetical protein